jgi:hypothetical protein
VTAINHAPGVLKTTLIVSMGDSNSWQRKSKVFVDFTHNNAVTIEREVALAWSELVEIS